MKLIPIGFGNYVSLSRLVAVLEPESNPIKRIVTQARQDGKLIDATYGRRTQAVLVMDSGHVVLCPVEPEQVRERSRENGGGDGT